MSDSKNKSPYQRMRRDFINNEPGARSDEAILELLLVYVLGYKDVKPAVAELLDKFGNLSAVLAASKKELEQIQGVGEATVALFKIIDFLRSETASNVDQDFTATRPPKESSTLPDTIPAQDDTSSVMAEEEIGTPFDHADQIDFLNEPVAKLDSEKEVVSQHFTGPSPKFTEPVQTTLWPSKESVRKDETKRKLQLSNSYMLEFDQLARVLNFLLENKEVKKISRTDLQEETGLAVRQIASLVSMGSAMGLIQPASQILTPIGRLIAENDIFIEKKGTLEWCHYVGAGSFSNLVWFEVFNHLLTKDSPMTMKEWTDGLRRDLAGQYSEATLKKHLQKEVRFVVDAYLERNFRKLELLHQGPEDVLYLRRYVTFEPLVLSAMLYDFCEQKQARLIQVDELAGSPGSPAVLFGLDLGTFRNLVEGLHEQRIAAL